MAEPAVIHLRARRQTDARPVLLTIAQAAARLNVGKRTMERWVAAGTVPHVRLDSDRLVRIPAERLDAWWQERLEGGR